MVAEVSVSVLLIAVAGLIVTAVPEIEVAPPETVKPAAVVKAEFVTSNPPVASTFPVRVEVESIVKAPLA